MIKYKYLHIVTLILLCINPLYTPADVIDELIVETSKQQAVATAPNKIILFVWNRKFVCLNITNIIIKPEKISKLMVC